MRPNKCRHYGQLQNKSTDVVLTSRGQIKASAEKWVVTTDNVPLEIVTLTGREAELARQIVASADTKITLRWIPDVTIFSRFVWNGHEYYVNWTDNVDQRNRELKCLCTEKIMPPVPEVE